MATQVLNKKPLRNRITFRLSDEHLSRYNACGGASFIRALIDEDIAKEERRYLKIKRYNYR